MSKLIQLTQGYSAIVDDDDYEWLMQWKWFACKNKGALIYARRREPITGKTLLMHREILGVSKQNVMVDHSNCNTLDNRRVNLRLCNHSQNAANANFNNHVTSQYKGVHFAKRESRWRASIRVNGKDRTLGYFSEEIDAALAYNRAAYSAWGEFAVLNLIITPASKLTRPVSR